MPISLATAVTAAAGGSRWSDVDRIELRRTLGGAVWDLKQVSGTVEHGLTQIDVRHQHTRIDSFGPSDGVAEYTPGRVTITDGANGRSEVFDHPRESFAGHGVDTPWTPPQVAYFVGYTMWTYTTEAWSLQLPGVVTEEDGTWTEAGRTLRRLRVTYPASIATHSRVQTLYVDGEDLVRRRDYEADVMGGVPSAQLVAGHLEVDGIVIATARDVFPRDPAGGVVADQHLVSIRLTDLAVA